MALIAYFELGVNIVRQSEPGKILEISVGNSIYAPKSVSSVVLRVKTVEDVDILVHDK